MKAFEGVAELVPSWMLNVVGDGGAQFEPLAPLIEPFRLLTLPRPDRLPSPVLVIVTLVVAVVPPTRA